MKATLLDQARMKRPPKRRVQPCQHLKVTTHYDSLESWWVMTCADGCKRTVVIESGEVDVTGNRSKEEVFHNLARRHGFFRDPPLRLNATGGLTIPW